MSSQRTQVINYLIKMRNKQGFFSQKWQNYQHEILKLKKDEK